MCLECLHASAAYIPNCLHNYLGFAMITLGQSWFGQSSRSNSHFQQASPFDCNCWPSTCTSFTRFIRSASGGSTRRCLAHRTFKLNSFRNSHRERFSSGNLLSGLSAAKLWLGAHLRQRTTTTTTTTTTATVNLIIGRVLFSRSPPSLSRFGCSVPTE